MADKSIDQLNEAEKIYATDLFVLQQSGSAKKLTGQVLLNWLTAAADGHGGIQSISKLSTSGLVDTYRITLADTTTFDFVVTNGRSITGIDKTSTSGLVDTYTISYNNGTTSNFTVTNGAKGDKGDNAYTWIKYASQEPTEDSHSMGDLPDDWIGIYSGNSSTAPTDWKQYKWFKHKGEQGPAGDNTPALEAAQTANAAAEAALAAANTANEAAQKANTAAAAAQQVVDSIVPDVNQLKDDKADKTALARTERSLDALWKLNQGVSYQFETEYTEAYQKTVPSGAKLASVEQIGGKTVVWNQFTKGILKKTGSFSNVNIGFSESTISVPEIEITESINTFTIVENSALKNGHTAYIYVESLGESLDPLIRLQVNRANLSGNVILDLKKQLYTADDDAGFRIRYGTKDVFKSCVFKFMVFDLTDMFGSGNEPTSIDDPRITWIEQYAAKNPEYNAGGLVSADVESIRYGDVVVTDIPAEVRNLPGCGWSSGDVYNSIERTDTGWQYVQRVGSREYQEGDTVTDGVTTYYALGNPVITDITDLMNGTLDAVTVEAGGTLTFENAAKLPVPNSVEYLVSLSEVNG